MVLKKILSIVLTVSCFCTSLPFSAFADTTDTNGDYGIAPIYEYAFNPGCILDISNNIAYCVSTTEGDAVEIKIEQQLQKYSGWFWIWNDVPDAKWVKVVYDMSISMANTKSGIDSGTYRLRSVFTLTNSNGKSETFTVYSKEVKVS